MTVQSNQAIPVLYRIAQGRGIDRENRGFGDCVGVRLHSCRTLRQTRAVVESELIMDGDQSGVRQDRHRLQSLRSAGMGRHKLVSRAPIPRDLRSNSRPVHCKRDDGFLAMCAWSVSSSKSRIPESSICGL